MVVAESHANITLSAKTDLIQSQELTIVTYKV